MNCWLAATLAVCSASYVMREAAFHCPKTKQRTSVFLFKKSCHSDSCDKSSFAVNFHMTVTLF